MLILILRWIVVTAAILLASRAVSGLHVFGWQSAATLALLLGALNLLVRPLLARLAALPPRPLVVGIAVLALNTVFFSALAAVVAGVYVDGILPAFLAAVGVTVFVAGLGALATPGASRALIVPFTGRRLF